MDFCLNQRGGDQGEDLGRFDKSNSSDFSKISEEFFDGWGNCVDCFLFLLFALIVVVFESEG